MQSLTFFHFVCLVRHRSLRISRLAFCAASCLISLLAISCASPADKGLVDDNPVNQIRAMKRAQEQHDVAGAATLVQRLSDEDPAVRFYAISALRRWTGDDFGYRYYDRESDRKPAVEQWQAWLKKLASGGKDVPDANGPGKVVDGK